jgi:hypothetical protein
MQDKAELMNDFRLTLNKDTHMCMSLAAHPGNFGTRLHNFLYAKLNLSALAAPLELAWSGRSTMSVGA